MRLSHAEKMSPHICLSVQSRASTDWPTPTCASPARWSVNAAGADLAPANKGDAHGPRAAVLERLPQAFAGVLPWIALYTGTSSTERVSFRQINKKTGNRLRQQLVDEVTREPVEGPDKGRGYEYAKNAYVPVDDDELDAIAIESNHTIEIDPFVPRQQIDERYLDTPYYIAPNDQAGQDAFAVIREAMRGKGMVALGRVVLSKRERVIMLEPREKGLIGTTLRYPYEVRDAKEYFDDIPEVKVEPDMLKLAEHILESKAATSTRPSSSITTRKLWSRCSKRSRQAWPYHASKRRRERITWSTSWTRSVAASRRTKRRLLVRRKAESDRRTGRNAASDCWQGQEGCRGKVHGSPERPPDEGRLTRQRQ